MVQILVIDIILLGLAIGYEIHLFKQIQELEKNKDTEI
jgi:hypothetical protein